MTKTIDTLFAVANVDEITAGLGLWLITSKLNDAPMRRVYWPDYLLDCYPRVASRIGIDLSDAEICRFARDPSDDETTDEEVASYWRYERPMLWMGEWKKVAEA
jgi:hypothetical protein